LYESGADPAVVLMDLAEFTHFVTRLKVVPAIADDPSFIEIERKQGRHFAEKLSMRVLSRAWQMLLKGIEEVTSSNRALAAAEMVLVRIAYAADLPTPDEVIRKLGGAPMEAPRESNGPVRARPAHETKRTESAVPGSSAVQVQAKPLAIERFEDMITLAGEKRDLATKSALERDVRLVRCEDGRLEIALEPNASKSLVNDLARKLGEWTGRPWIVEASRQEGAATVKAQNEARQQELKTGVRAHPLVQAVLERFPGSEIVDVRTPAAAMAEELNSEQEMPEAVEEEQEDLSFGLRSRER
jgi:DNA polymerase-3 subunit gamma/tau